MVSIGVDGCKAGWLAVRIGRTHDAEVRVFASIAELWKTWCDSADIVLIDVLIGEKEWWLRGSRADRLSATTMKSWKIAQFLLPMLELVEQTEVEVLDRRSLRPRDARGFVKQAVTSGRRHCGGLPRTGRCVWSGHGSGAGARGGCRGAGYAAMPTYRLEVLMAEHAEYGRVTRRDGRHGLSNRLTVVAC